MNLLKTLFRHFFISVGVLSLIGCTSMKIASFSNKNPRFIPEQYFLGKVRGYGVFYDRFHRVRRSFILYLTGILEGDTIILAEDLRFQDGERVKREYRLTKIDEHNYSAHSDAFVGDASVKSYGNALQWNYTLKQKIGDDEWHLHFDDWMFLQEDDVVLNRARATKWGLDVGEVFMTFQRVRE